MLYLTHPLAAPHLRGLIQQDHREGTRSLPQGRLPQQGTGSGPNHRAGGESALAGCLGASFERLKLSSVWQQQQSIQNILQNI
jgi:hypothetical protein